MSIDRPVDPCLSKEDIGACVKAALEKMSNPDVLRDIVKDAMELEVYLAECDKQDRLDPGARYTRITI